MKIRHLILQLLVFSCLPVLANHPLLPWEMPRSTNAEIVSCNLPAPNDLTIVNIGTTWVEATWSVIPNAFQYRLQAYDGASGAALGAPTFVNGSATAAIVPTIGNNGTVFVRIWSVCDNGEYNEARYDQSDTIEVIIIDLVVMGYQWPQMCGNYQIPLNTGVNIPTNGDFRYFKTVYAPGGDTLGAREFPVKFAPTYTPKKLQVGMDEGGNNGQTIIFDVYNQDLSMGSKFQIYFKGENGPKLIAEFTGVYTATGTVSFVKTGTDDPDCKVHLLFPCLLTKPGQPDPELLLEEREVNPSFTSQPLAKPNPFGIALNVQLPETSDADGTTMYLYDLLGARRMTYHAPANETECQLNTSMLEPGVYFLRIESGGKAETIKLIKQE